MVARSRHRNRTVTFTSTAYKSSAYRVAANHGRTDERADSAWSSQSVGACLLDCAREAGGRFRRLEAWKEATCEFGNVRHRVGNRLDCAPFLVQCPSVDKGSANPHEDISRLAFGAV